MKKTIRVGNAQAFWGDRPSAAVELLAQEPDIDYLTMDYLAEVSMSILALQRERDPKLGYAQDFVEVVRGLAVTGESIRQAVAASAAQRRKNVSAFRKIILLIRLSSENAK